MEPFVEGSEMAAADTDSESKGESSHSKRLSLASTAVSDQITIDDHVQTMEKDKDNMNPLKIDTMGPLTSTFNPDHLRFLNLRPIDHLKTLLLLLLSLVTLPFSLAAAYLASTLPPHLLPSTANLLHPASATAYRLSRRRAPSFHQKTILVTGISMTKGLTLARAFHLEGHRVVGADFAALRSSVWLPVWLNSGRRFSRALAAVYSLERPAYTPTMSATERAAAAERYAQAMLTIIDDEKVDLWVSCSGVGSAVEDGLISLLLRKRRGSKEAQAGRRCMAVQFEEAITKKLHDKRSFTRHLRDELNLGMHVPETHEVASQAAAAKILLDSLLGNTGDAERGRNKFILKPAGVDDAHRGNMTLLPLSVSPSKPPETYPGQATTEYVDALPISRQQPWLLQRFVPGGREFCTHALVVDGRVVAFVACKSSEMLMHYKALPADDALRKRMLSFTRKVARAAGERGETFTGHLSFDFMVEDARAEGEEEGLFVIECNPRAHTAVVLFAAPGEAMRDMVRGYLSVFEEEGGDGGAGDSGESSAPASGKKKFTAQKQQQQQQQQPEYKKWHLDQLKPLTVAGPPADVAPRYWLGHDLVALVLLPFFKLFVQPLSIADFGRSVRQLLQHVLFWKEAVFELWDPWPFVALYHVYWPAAIAEAWWKGERWSRVNVSTTKMFMC